ncbi:P2Y purinoceptor 3 [Esox lucius]|uniref:G-protein coupled receptors family 1 profile domain-containing protein n=1 Tax=Esox lucius TaxID=8010 RepID=A0A3P8ZVM9_ESOLU|nr:P2Y purinoceptor 3 [Esox lucius]XP_010898121.1 P2Y purinoceptor 3 [Esox lucius]XP_010898122.1 P2Y purinoceptor 3 [Esox lucius]
MTMTKTNAPALNEDDFIVVGVHRLFNSTSVDPSLHPSCSIDESYKYIFLPLCYSFTFLFSISLNSIILWRSFRRTKRWNASLIYMVNLASTDFMYGLSLPFLVASYVMRDQWIFGDFMCRLVRFLFYFNLYCSIFFLTCISVHRYLGICHPMRTITLETKRAVKGTCVLVWVVVFALTCPIFRFAQTSLVMRGLGGEAMAINGNNTGTGGVETYQNCWDDAIDKEFQDYVPYGIILHLLGFFLPFSIIAWCYSHVVLTIFRTLHSQPQPRGRAEDGGGGGRGGGAKRNGAGVVGGGLQGGEEGASIVLGAHSPYAHRRRKSIKTIITITLLFALCFFPFHVTRTIFLIRKVTKGVPCHTMTMVSMCYKITRPLASFNAWLNALLYFLTKEKGAGTPCCQPPDTTSNNQQHGLLWPLRMLGRVGEGERGEEGGVVNNWQA